MLLSHVKDLEIKRVSKPGWYFSPSMSLSDFINLSEINLFHYHRYHYSYYLLIYFIFFLFMPCQLKKHYVGCKWNRKSKEIEKHFSKSVCVFLHVLYELYDMKFYPLILIFPCNKVV